MTVSNAKTVFLVELEHVRESVNFLCASVALRSECVRMRNAGVDPGIGQFGWGLVRTFAAMEDMSSGSISRGLYVSLAAATERFVRTLVSDLVHAHAIRARAYGKVEPRLVTNNVKYSGRVMSRAPDFPVELSIGIEEICANLGTCTTGSSNVRLNGAAFAVALEPLTADGWLEALKRAGVDLNWDQIGSDKDVQMVIGTTATRETKKELEAFLNLFTKQRNQIVHGGSGQPPISLDELRRTIAVLEAVSKRLFDVLEQGAML